MICLLAPLSIAAAEYSIEPRLRLMTELDDNRRLLVEPEGGVGGGSLRVAARSAFRTETTEIVLTPTLEFWRYKGDDALDSDDQMIELASSHWNEWGRMGLSAAFIRDSTSTSELEAIGRVFDRKRRERLELAPSFEYALSERTSVQASVAYQDTRFEDGEEVGLFDYSYVGGQGTVLHNLSEVDQVFGTLLGSSFEVPDLSSSTDSYGFLAGLSHSFSPVLQASFGAGMVHSDSEVEQFGVSDEIGTNGALLSASLEVKQERTSLTASFSRSLFPTSLGDLVQRDEVDLRLIHRIDPRLSAEVDLLAFDNTSLGDLDPTGDDTYFRVLAGLRWRVSEHVTLVGSYRYRNDKSGDEADAADSNAVVFSVVYAGDKVAWSR